MELTCRDAYAIYLQHAGGLDTERFVASLRRILRMFRPHCEDAPYITHGQYTMLWSIMDRLRGMRLQTHDRMRILEEIVAIPIGNYAIDEQRHPMSDLVRMALGDDDGHDAHDALNGYT